jgi:pseudouridine-5'-phosphate glycosidase
MTPFLLDRLHAGTAGASLEVNVRLVRRNAALAAAIAAAAGGEHGAVH